jgi:hypothetical protein
VERAPVVGEIRKRPADVPMPITRRSRLLERTRWMMRSTRSAPRV